MKYKRQSHRINVERLALIANGILALKGKQKMKKEKGKKKHFKVNKVSLQLYIMASFAMISVFVFNYLPMGGIVLAFKNYKYSRGIFGSDWVWFKNFEYFFKSEDFAMDSH